MPDIEMTLAEREAYEERAAIREFEGGQSRAEAEKEALREIVLERLRKRGP